MTGLRSLEFGGGWTWQLLEPSRVMQRMSRLGKRLDGKMFYEFLAWLDHADESDWAECEEMVRDHFPWLLELLEEQTVAHLQQTCSALLEGEVEP